MRSDESVRSNRWRNHGRPGPCHQCALATNDGVTGDGRYEIIDHIANTFIDKITALWHCSHKISKMHQEDIWTKATQHDRFLWLSSHCHGQGMGDDAPTLDNPTKSKIQTFVVGSWHQSDGLNCEGRWRSKKTRKQHHPQVDLDCHWGSRRTWTRCHSLVKQNGFFWI